MDISNHFKVIETLQSLGIDPVKLKEIVGREALSNPNAETESDVLYKSFHERQAGGKSSDGNPNSPVSLKEIVWKVARSKPYTKVGRNDLNKSIHDR